jgi:hypothetical protein
MTTVFYQNLYFINKLVFGVFIKNLTFTIGLGGGGIFACFFVKNSKNVKGEGVH